MAIPEQIGEFLLEKAHAYNQSDFIKEDPISLPHRFTNPRDIEIIGFWVAMLAWGQRVTIINKGLELVQLMDGAPYDFILNHAERDRKRFLDFKHRTFQATDTLYFLEFLQRHYQAHDNLEAAFIPDEQKGIDFTVKEALTHFHKYFFSLPYAPKRTQKHVATPARNSGCKRLNMFLRWMVRKDDKGVDFGIWNTLQPQQLHIPLDVHVEKIARQYGLLKRKSRDWKAVEELTQAARTIHPDDPALLDFALFGLSVYG